MNQPHQQRKSSVENSRHHHQQYSGNPARFGADHFSSPDADAKMDMRLFRCECGFWCSTRSGKRNLADLIERIGLVIYVLLTSAEVDGSWYNLTYQQVT